MNNRDFKDYIDNELKNISFTSGNRFKVKEGILKKRGRIKYLLEMEIKIPVKPLAAAVLIAVTVVFYAGFGISKVTAEEVNKSKVIVLDGMDLGGQNEIYKN